MKFKQMLSLSLVGVLALSLAACGVPAASTSTSVGAPVSAPSSEAMPASQADGANAMQAVTPPYNDSMQSSILPGDDVLSADRQELYNAAVYWMGQFKISTGFAIDYEGTPITMDNGMEYYPDNGFESYSKFRAALDATFTTELANALLNESMAYVDDGNDKLFSLDAARGTNIFFKGVDYTLVSESDTEIVIGMTAHYAKEMTDTGEFGKEETTEEFEQHLVKTDAGWRFAQFNLPY